MQFCFFALVRSATIVFITVLVTAITNAVMGWEADFAFVIAFVALVTAIEAKNPTP